MSLASMISLAIAAIGAGWAATAALPAAGPTVEESATAPVVHFRNNKAWVHFWVHNCQFEPDFLRLPVGKAVHFSVTSEDTEHVFSIKLCRDCRNSLLEMRVPAGRSADGECTFPRPGEYCIFCTAHDSEALSVRILVE